MDDEFAVLDGYGHNLEWAAGLVVSEIQDSVVGVVIWCWDPENYERVVDHILGAGFADLVLSGGLGEPQEHGSIVPRYSQVRPR